MESVNALWGGAADKCSQVLMQTMHQRRSWRLNPGREGREGLIPPHPHLNLDGRGRDGEREGEREMERGRDGEREREREREGDGKKQQLSVLLIKFYFWRGT